MKSIFKNLILTLTVAGLLLHPFPVALGQEIDLPPQVVQSVPAPDLIELLYCTSQWRSGDMFAHLDAADEVLTPLLEEVRQVLGTPVAKPNTAQVRREMEDKIEAVRRSTTVAEAQRLATELAQGAQKIDALYQQWLTQFQPAITALQAKGTEIGVKVQAQVADLVAQEEARIRQELEGKIARRVEEIKASITRKSQARVQSLIAFMGRNVDPVAIQREVTDFVMAEVERERVALTQEIQQEVAAAEQKARQRVEERVRSLVETEAGKLLKIRDGFQNVNQRIEEAAKKKLAAYDVYRQKALKKKAEIIGRALEAQFAKAQGIIKSQAPLVAAARAQGRQVPDLDALQADLERDKKLLMASLEKAETREETEEALSFFTAGWESKRKEMELLKVQGAQELLQETATRLRQGDVENKLRSGLETARDGIKALEGKQTREGQLDAKNKKRLAQLKVLQGQLVEALALLEEFKKAQPTDDLSRLLNLVDRLQSKLEAVQRAASQESQLKGAGIFIEAENESATRLLKRTENWHSTREVNATWRPSPSGGADWYLSRGGEALIYDFEVTVEGTYYLWIRDLSANNHLPGAASVQVVMDGVELGTFRENAVRPPYPPGVFAWHKTASVALKAGKHRLEIVKPTTTSSAAILDAFYLTADPNDAP